MIAEIVDRPDGLPDVDVEATPLCGKDFCDSCGDCLECLDSLCYGDNPPRAAHRWVVYADLQPERAAELLKQLAARTPGAPSR